VNSSLMGIVEAIFGGLVWSSRLLCGSQLNACNYSLPKRALPATKSRVNVSMGHQIRPVDTSTLVTWSRPVR
jgi:hypothetical protein